MRIPYCFRLGAGEAENRAAQHDKSKVPGSYASIYVGTLSLGAIGRHVVNRMRLVLISGDTGLSPHIGAALGKPIIMDMGKYDTPDLGMMSPQKPNSGGDIVSMEVKGLNCRPCSKLGYTECPKGHFKCMDQ